MARLTIDKNRLGALLASDHHLPAADRLYRDGSVFFIGGTLPLHQTLETMFSSFCTEATTIFYLSFGSQETVSQGLEMARQIKNNFRVRLMVRLESAVDGRILERLYTAGVDNLDLRLPGDLHTELPEIAREVFPRWGIASTQALGAKEPAITIDTIARLLAAGIVPLAQVSARSAGLSAEQIDAALDCLAAGWERSAVPLHPYLPLIGIMTPLVPEKPAGMFRGLADRLRNRQQLAGAELRRHLRVQPAEHSLDSAGL